MHGVKKMIYFRILVIVGAVHKLRGGVWVGAPKSNSLRRPKLRGGEWFKVIFTVKSTTKLFVRKNNQYFLFGARVSVDQKVDEFIKTLKI